jgi:predicted Ser/Thr protein kinase
VPERAAEGRAEARPPPTEGRPFGPYDLLEELGRGTSGVVFRALHRSLRRECALKVLSADLARGRSALRFLREGQAAAKLGRHPHLVQVFDAGMVDGTPFIAMELIRGESLDRRIQRAGPLPEADLLDIGRKLALTLDHAHRCGIIHRDIKPANIVLSEEGEPVILDFGIAKDLQSQAEISLEGNVIGTPAFMAPEQANPERGRVDRRSDVYALGATLFFAATGAIPFDGASVHEIIYRVLTSELDTRPLAERVSPGLEAVIARAMERDPDARYATALELADDLSRLIAGEPPRTRPRGTVARLTRRALRRHGEAIAVLALFVVFTIGASAYFAMRRAESRELWQRLSREIAESVASDLRAMLEPAEPTLDELRLLAERGLLPVGDPEQLADHLAVRFRYRTRFDWLSYGDERGRFTGAERREDGAVLLNRSWLAPSGGRLREELMHPDGTRTPLRQSDRWTYDPRERPFYKVAAQAEGPVWTPPYPWFDGDGWGLTLALANRDAEGRLLGVFTADFRLAALSRRLAQREIGASGRAWLLDRAGTALAGPGVEGPRSPRDPLLEAALAAAPRPLAEVATAGSVSFSFEREGRAHASTVAVFRAARGLDLATLIVVPSDEFEGGLSAQAARVARWAAGALVAATAIVFALGIRRRSRLLAALREGRRRREESGESGLAPPTLADERRGSGDDRGGIPPGPPR